MTRGWAVMLALLATACGGGDDAGNAGAEASANAATPAAAATPLLAATGPAPRTPSTTLPAGEGIPGVTAPPPVEQPGPATDVGSPVGMGDDSDGAADVAAAVQVVRDYFTAIGERRYADAYRLWGGQGQAAGMSAKAFADSHARYADYRATIGTPGRVDPGAGQRYIEIPVQVTGRLRDGTPVRMAGPVTLHRTGPIDGATLEQRSWRISASALKPRPAGYP